MYQANSRSTRRATWCSRRCATRVPSSASSTACSDLKEIDPTHYEAVFETRVAYLKFKFNVTVEVTSAEEPSEIEAKIEGNAARRGRPADREVDHHGWKTPATRPRSPIRSNPRSPASSAASASRCCAPRPRTWKSNSPTRLRAAFAADRRRRINDPVRPRRTDLARGSDQAARSRRSDDPSDRRRHRADADDEGRRVPAGEARQPAQDREQVFEHRGRRRRACASAR